jgi:hypothetical protein
MPRWPTRCRRANRRHRLDEGSPPVLRKQRGEGRRVGGDVDVMQGVDADDRIEAPRIQLQLEQVAGEETHVDLCPGCELARDLDAHRTEVDRRDLGSARGQHARQHPGTTREVQDAQALQRAERVDRHLHIRFDSARLCALVLSPRLRDSRSSVIPEPLLTLYILSLHGSKNVPPPGCFLQSRGSISAAAEAGEAPLRSPAAARCAPARA